MTGELNESPAGDEHPTEMLEALSADAFPPYEDDTG